MSKQDYETRFNNNNNNNKNTGFEIWLPRELDVA